MIEFLPIQTTYYLGPILIPPWGVFAFISVIIFILLYLRGIQKYKIPENHAIHAMIHFSFWTIMGTTIFYRLFFSGCCCTNSILTLNGRDSAGIFIGIIALLTYLKYYKQDIKNYLDMIIIPVIGLGAVMRIGCLLIADELGKVSTLPWAMFYEGAFRHNMGLYYVIINFSILGLLFYFEKHKFKKGNLFLFGLISYSLTRVLIDFLREIPPHDYFGFSLQQIFYIILTIVGIIVFGLNNNWFKNRKNKIKL
jgi:prolipoprotein diacylglyceryltransferase